jgi:hypothetical protein
MLQSNTAVLEEQAIEKLKYESPPLDTFPS